jgi:ribosomal protein S12 methylthiotransferase accessory factor
VVAAGSRIALWDLSASDSGPCVIGCALVEDPREPAWRALGVYQGFGAHLAPEIAIARALTEAAQTRVTYIAGARDDFFPIDYERATDPELHAAMWDTITTPCDEPVAFTDLPATRTSDLADDLAHLLALAPAAIAVDLDHPALGVPVVKVIVPGLAADTTGMG